MKKKALLLVCLAAAVVLLLAVYAGVKGKGKADREPEPEVMESGEYKLVTLDLKNIKKITVENENGGLVFVNENDALLVENADMKLLDSEAVLITVNALINISSDNEIGAGTELSQYGLDAPQASVIYETKDGGQKLLLGAETADNNYYYAMDADKKTVYTIGKNTGEKMLQGVVGLADLDLDILDAKGLALVDVEQKDREPLRIEFDRENEISKDNEKKTSLQTLVMHSPIENMLVYPYNLETGLLYNYSSFKLEKMVETNDDDFEKYGLSDPVMTIKLADTENSVEVAVGSLTEDEKSYYVAANGKKAVYTMPKTAIDPFFEYDIINFIQKFIALHYRDTLDKIEINSVYGDYTVEFKEENGRGLTEKDGKTEDKRREYINGKAVDSEAFTTYYEMLVGLSFDALQQTEIKGEPQVVITYKMLDGTEDKVSFYDYDDTFFTVLKGDGDNTMLINKQQVKQAIDKAKELVK